MKKTLENFRNTQYKYQTFTLDILIPIGQEFRFLLPGSGIVANPTPTADNYKSVRYEGNKYGVINLGTYEDRLLTAAHRLWSNYPTVARMSLNEEYLSEFLTVGSLSVFSEFNENPFNRLEPFQNGTERGTRVIPYGRGMIYTTVFDYKDEHLDCLNAYIASYKSAK
jgi:hypothetical protein